MCFLVLISIIVTDDRVAKGTSYLFSDKILIFNNNKLNRTHAALALTNAEKKMFRIREFFTF